MYQQRRFYFDDIDESIEKGAIKQLNWAKKQGLEVVRQLINNLMYEKMRYSIESTSNSKY